jgi:hypothetical protein
MVARAMPGDLADWTRRRGDVRRVEVQALTAKRVRIGVRLANGALTTRYVKPEKLERAGGGGCSMKARDLARERIVRLLIEHFRHRPCCLPPAKAVQVLRRLIRNAIPGATGTDCVLWGGNVNNDGYGRINVSMRGETFTFYVHRLAAQFAGHVDAIPKWREVAHACNTPACFSPLCVSVQRRKDNRRDSALNTHRKIARRKLQELRRRREMKEHREAA